MTAGLTLNMGAPERLATLDAIEAALWRELARAVHDRHHTWRLATLATVAADGRPDARTLVLRECSRVEKTLFAYTDARSAKVAQLRALPQAVLVLWSAALGWQLRLQVAVAVETEGDAVATRWAQVMHTPAARDYLSADAPGAVVGNSSANETAGHGHFALLRCQVQRVDWLELHRDGHRRAAFDGDGARWLVP